MDQAQNRISKYLSFLLRHQPEAIGLVLDAEGWADIDELISKTTRFALTPTLIAEVVASNDKQRFALSPDKTKIRANQGHSVGVELNLMPVEPPIHLYHGTATRFLPQIQATGLNKQSRQHVHLSACPEVAKTVGSRHGKPVVLTVSANAMHQAGFQFYLSQNQVWLVEQVPGTYLQLTDTVI